LDGEEVLQFYSAICKLSPMILNGSYELNRLTLNLLEISMQERELLVHWKRQPITSEHKRHFYGLVEPRSKVLTELFDLHICVHYRFICKLFSVFRIIYKI
jgi:hypothetical protein